MKKHIKTISLVLFSFMLFFSINLTSTAQGATSSKDTYSSSNDSNSSVIVMNDVSVKEFFMEEESSDKRYYDIDFRLNSNSDINGNLRVVAEVFYDDGDSFPIEYDFYEVSNSKKSSLELSIEYHGFKGYHKNGLNKIKFYVYENNELKVKGFEWTK